ncbi:MAG: hypothetical protein A2015_17160 [Spirochaetes bacterium GWF1_31_7]|nr:MAG: hypothetical protein A2Y30_14525 [Spirochaetes bacterium GWE1_32_154]OHD50170.1 MAG: hypothetical protein A2Y29_12570 [Spirochaetes bacterium GWE2_31_10]OHD52484.1 MAG: hypothetical protein A2015_17160 [Spirochaetes bacterium GWF1_31_7]HBD94129.1 hypothetical protein [Spirochaetia bacterium]HBI38642.1 hypothetical protein [Spirochaetia bacterium]
MDRKDFLIKTLELRKHPEGGYYKETYRSDDILSTPPARFNNDQRNISTAIYYLLGRNEQSKFHRIKSDEIWHHYEGDPIILYIMDTEGLRITKLGRVGNGMVPQVVIKHGCWFAAETTGTAGYAFVGCTVAPGFDFADFEIGEEIKLLQENPEFAAIIKRFS